MAIRTDLVPVFRLAPLAGAGRGLQWYVAALRLWRRAIVKLVLLALVPLALEGFIQLIPVAGMVLSKVVVPLFGAGLLIGVDHLARTGKLSWGCILAGFTRRRLPGLVVLSLAGLAVPATQVGVAALVYGPGAVDAVVLGHMRAHPELISPVFAEVLILPGVVIATLLTLSGPLFLFEGLRPISALGQSLRRVAAAWPAFVAALVPQLLLLALALSSPLGILLMIVFQPLSTLVGYVAYREVVGRPLASRPASGGAEVAAGT